MTTNPFSRLLTAYPHLYRRLETIKTNYPTTIPNPVPARKWPSLSIPGTYLAQGFSPGYPRSQVAPPKPAVDINAFTPCQSSSNLQLKAACWNSWLYTDGSCQVQNGKTVRRTGVYHACVFVSECVCDYIEYTHGQPQLTSPTQRASLASRKAQASVQGVILKMTSNLARTSQGHIFFYKVKSHTGTAGNKCADKIAKYQASLKVNNLTDTGK
eukprot:1141278-Pelagomonas_calceolata.AAC.6